MEESTLPAKPTRERAVELMKVYSQSVISVDEAIKTALLGKKDYSVSYTLFEFVLYTFWYSNEYGIPLKEAGIEEEKLKKILVSNMRVELTPDEEKEFWESVRKGRAPKEPGSINFNLVKGGNHGIGQ